MTSLPAIENLSNNFFQIPALEIFKVNKRMRLTKELCLDHFPESKVYTVDDRLKHSFYVVIDKEKNEEKLSTCFSVADSANLKRISIAIPVILKQIKWIDLNRQSLSSNLCITSDEILDIKEDLNE